MTTENLKTITINKSNPYYSEIKSYFKNEWNHTRVFFIENLIKNNSDNIILTPDLFFGSEDKDMALNNFIQSNKIKLNNDNSIKEEYMVVIKKLIQQYYEKEIEVPVELQYTRTKQCWNTIDKGELLETIPQKFKQTDLRQNLFAWKALKYKYLDNIPIKNVDDDYIYIQHLHLHLLHHI